MAKSLNFISSESGSCIPRGLDWGPHDRDIFIGQVGKWDLWVCDCYENAPCLNCTVIWKHTDKDSGSYRTLGLDADPNDYWFRTGPDRFWDLINGMHLLARNEYRRRQAAGEQFPTIEVWGEHLATPNNL